MIIFSRDALQPVNASHVNQSRDRRMVTMLNINQQISPPGDDPGLTLVLG
jgi:hypothetical protein